MGLLSELTHLAAMLPLGIRRRIDRHTSRGLSAAALASTGRFLGDLRLQFRDATLQRAVGEFPLIQPVAITLASGTALEQGYVWELVAGFTRYAAVCKLQHTEISVTVRDANEDAQQHQAAIAAARAMENIARVQLNPHEEAVALQAMLNTGLSTDGAAQALGWPKTRVTARLKLLALPETAQRLIGNGTLPSAAIDSLRAIGIVIAPLLDR